MIFQPTPRRRVKDIPRTLEDEDRNNERRATAQIFADNMLKEWTLPPCVALILLWGGVACNRDKAGSDIDIAVVFAVQTLEDHPVKETIQFRLAQMRDRADQDYVSRQDRLHITPLGVGDYHSRRSDGTEIGKTIETMHQEGVVLWTAD